jgi:polar amino acid transport system substrate-binding protein
MKRLSYCIAAFAAATALCSAAQAQDLPDRIKAAKTIVVANVPNYPPMEFKDPKTGALTGVDIELGEALGKKLGVTIKWEEVSFEQMISALSTGRVDMILSGMSDLPKRRDSLDFLDYMKSGAQFYTLASNKDAFKTPTDLCGKQVGTSRRTSFPAEIEKWSKEHCEAAGKPAIVVVGTEGSADARTQLRQKRVDAAVQGSETIPYMMELEPNTYIAVGPAFTAVLQGMGFNKKEPALREAVTKAFAAMMADGSYKAILAKWKLDATALDGVYINGEKK